MPRRAFFPLDIACLLTHRGSRVPVGDVATRPPVYAGIPPPPPLSLSLRDCDCSFGYKLLAARRAHLASIYIYISKVLQTRLVCLQLFLVIGHLGKTARLRLSAITPGPNSFTATAAVNHNVHRHLDCLLAPQINAAIYSKIYNFFAVRAASSFVRYIDVASKIQDRRHRSDSAWRTKHRKIFQAPMLLVFFSRFFSPGNCGIIT